MKRQLFHQAVALVLALIMLIPLPSAALAAGGARDTTEETETGGGTNTDDTPILAFSEDTKKNGIILPLGTSQTLSTDQVTITGFPEGTTYRWSISGTAVDLRNWNREEPTLPTLVPQAVTNSALTLTVAAEYTDAEGNRQTPSDTCHVQVVYATPNDLTLGRQLMELDVGNDPAQSSITAIQWVTTEGSGTQADLCDPSNITWSVTNEDGEPDNTVVRLSATHGATNYVTALRPGEATIVATVKGKNANGEDITLVAKCVVTVNGILINRLPTAGSTEKKEEVTDKTITIPEGSDVWLECETIGSKFNGTFSVWESTNQNVATISTDGQVTAQNVGSTQIRVTQAGYVAYCTVVVERNTVGFIEASITGDQTLNLYSLLADLNRSYREAMDNAGRPASSAGLSYVTNLSVSPDEGVLYYNYVSPSNHGYGVGGSELYYVNPGVGGRGLSGVTFVPNQGFNGEAVIQYSGYDANGNSFTGTIRVAVTASKDVAYVTQINTPINFMMDDFNDVHLGATGRDVRYVTFELPDPKQGTLYYDYLGTGEYSTLVTANDRFGRVTSPYMDRVRFVPAEGFAGVVRIVYHVTDTGYAVSTGRVNIQVTSQSGVSTEIKYVNQRGEEQPFRVADFNNLCWEVLDEENLDYLYFTLPDSSLGTLWYSYNSTSGRSRVTASTRYYRNNSSARPGVGGVYFEPNEGTVGLVTIPFTVYSTSGNRFQGTVSIQYNDVGEGELNFRIRASETVIFNAADFNEECLDATGTSFDYVRFDRLPSATTQGSLHSNYYSASSVGSRITNLNNLYYRTGSLSRVAFIPVISFSGTVSIPFTAYKSDGSRVFSGTINIQVEGIGDFTVRYNAFSGRAVRFDVESFAAACQLVTGNSLNYVRFELSSSARGKLYYNYSASKTSNTVVNSTTNYYRSSSYSRKISDVSFVPDSNFVGTLTFSYSGVATNNAKYTGTIEIQVSAPVAETIYNTGASLPVAMNAAAFYQACSQVLPQGLSYIEFTSLPAESQGVMYWNYAPPSPGTRVTTGTRYYYSGNPGINWLAFVPKAEFNGLVSIGYRGYDSNGVSATGTVYLNISSAATLCHFRDMELYTWAAPSTEFLYQSGIVQGTNMERMEYSPADHIERGQFTAMLCRAFGLETASTTSFPDVRADEYYAKAIATAKDLGIVTGGADGLFRPDEALPRQEAMLMLYRAMSVAGYKLPATGANLSAYPDGWQVGQEYRAAVSVMLQMDVMRGNENRQLLPEDTLSRAEMAVVLHRALTLPRT